MQPECKKLACERAHHKLQVPFWTRLASQPKLRVQSSKDLRESRSRSQSGKKVKSYSHSRLGGEIFGSSEVPSGPKRHNRPIKHFLFDTFFRKISSSDTI
jgi:hypothetical protein